jgi:DnaJ like chaperone protein
VEEMSLWEKLAGALAGLGSDAHMAGGGPIGELLTGLVALGRENNKDGILDSEEYRESFVPQQQVAFTVGVVALGAKMAKADGVVTRDEVTAFKEVFKVPPGEMKNVSRIFNLAKQDVVGYESYAKQLVSLLKDNTRLLEDVLEGLFHIATADGEFHPNEEQFLAQVARLFGFTDTEFSYVKARNVSSGKHNPYEVLGVGPEIDNEALKIHYCKLIADHHPDRMIARGVPPGFVTIATKKIAAINAAYEAVINRRNI